MERGISVFIEAKNEKMVSQTHLPPMWDVPSFMVLSKQPTEVMVLSSMENIPIFPPRYVIHMLALDD